MKAKQVVHLSIIGALLAGAAGQVAADQFTQEEVADWTAQYMSVVDTGRNLWGSGTLGTNNLACGQCHPNAANTHPETYPKFQKQLGKVAQIWEMINWCIDNPLQGERLNADDSKMTALQAYIAYERRGVALAPGKH